MDYLDREGNYSKSNVINGIIDIDDKIQEEFSKENIDNKKITQLRYEQMLRGLYMWDNPYV